MKINFIMYFRKYKKLIIYSVFINFIVILSNISLPFLQGQMIGVIENQSIIIKDFTLLFVAVILMYISWNGTSIINDHLFETINKNIENDILIDCINRIYHAKLESIINISDGEIITRITRDSRSINKIFEHIYSYIFTVLNTFILVIAMLLIHFQFSIILIVIYVLIIVIQKYSSKQLKDAFTNYKEVEDKMYCVFSDQLRGILTAKVLNNESTLLNRFTRKSKENIESFKKITIKLGFIRYGNFIILGVFKVSTIFIGGILYLHNSVSIAIIFTMFAYSQQLAALLRKLIEVDVLKKDMYSSIDRLNEFMKQFEGYNDEHLSELIKINQISSYNLSYIIENKHILQNVNFNASRGDILIIKGKNGAGKTTLSYFLNGLIKSDSITFNNKNRMELSTKSIISRTTCVLQNGYIFPGTICDNLTNFGAYSIKQVDDIISSFNLTSFFKTYGDNYQKTITDKNLTISGGEKQVISLIRALLKDFDVLILDELDNSLDINVKMKIIDGLKRNYKDKIIFIISHDASMIELSTKTINL